jgi:hypothetical protein
MSSGKKLTGTASSRVPGLRTSDGSNINITGITVTASSIRNGSSISPERDTSRQEIFARPSSSATTSTLAATKIGSGQWTSVRDQSGNYILPENARREINQASSQFSRNLNDLAANTAKNIEFVDGSSKFSFSDSQISEALGRNNSSTEENASQTAAESNAASIEETTTFNRKPTTDYKILKYPIKAIAGDYLKIELLEYKKSGLFSEEGKFGVSRADDRINNVRGTVFLPIQSGIIDNCSVDWGQGELNPITAQFAAGAYGTIGAAGGEGGLSAAFSQLGSSIKSILDTFSSNTPELRALLVNYFTQEAVGTPGLLSRTLGGAINNNLELLFNGPTLRSFTFTFRLTPREPKEADEIKKIIRMFKTEMQPQLSEGELFLLAPNVFKLSYKQFFEESNGTPRKKFPEDNHQFLNRIKICALKDFSVNYTPDGSYMTYADDGSMTAYELNMTFAELSPIFKEDYTESDEGQVGMGW